MPALCYAYYAYLVYTMFRKLVPLLSSYEWFITITDSL